MANKRVGTLEMRVRLEAGDVEPKHLGVTLPDFTEWARPTSSSGMRTQTEQGGMTLTGWRECATHRIWRTTSKGRCSFR